MSQPSRAPDPEHLFISLYESVYPDLVRFVQRRAHPDHAEDVAAEALLTVWRRLDDLPAHPEDARAWTFGITRNILLHEHRGQQRRRALSVRLADPTPSDSAANSDADAVLSRIDLSRGWNLLSEVHQEALALSVFEDLTAPQAALALDISPVAYRLRLSRARRALRLHLDHLPHQSDTTRHFSERTTQS